MAEPETLSTRTLNRTLLTRQFLTERTTAGPLEVIRHLVAMQAQEPNWPYIGLWTRITGFAKDDLLDVLTKRQAVHATSIRRTVHICAADDFRWLRPTVAPIVQSALRAAYYREQIGDLDLEELLAAGEEIVAGGTMLRRDLGKRLTERYPGRHGARLADTVDILRPMVRDPYTSVWGLWRSRANLKVSFADDWIGEPMLEPDVRTMVLRYLAAFGPAGVRDVQAWSGVTKLRAVLDEMRSELRVYRDEQGKELFDLPDAELAGEDTEAPVRFLPGYDNVLLGHADRTRVIADEYRQKVAPGGALVLPTFLVDGFVRGLWSFEETPDVATLTVTPFVPLSTKDKEQVMSEAERLHDFIDPAAEKRAVTLEGN